MKILLAVIAGIILCSGCSAQMLQSISNAMLPPSTFSDSFTRANGGLGSNWVEPNGANCALQIISDQVFAASTPCIHALDIWNNGSFSNNQWTKFLVESNTTGSSSTFSSQAAVVRGLTGSAQFYNDAVPTLASGYRIGPPSGVDFCRTDPLATYSIGDTHELDVAGSGPVFFWAKHNGTVMATCVDTVNNFTGGAPGLGVIDQNVSPTIADGAWSGGSLPNFSATPSDNFTRANDGWLGVNWWFSPTTGTGANDIDSAMVLNSNAAQLSISGGTSVALWTTPFAANHSSTVTFGNLVSSDWIGAVTRYALPASNVNAAPFYLAIDIGGEIDLFEYSGSGYNLLSDLGHFSGTATTLELDATGASPVSLVVKVNGTQFGSTFNDSTYLLTGTYAGFAIFGSTSTNVSGWVGANI